MINKILTMIKGNISADTRDYIFTSALAHCMSYCYTSIKTFIEKMEQMDRVKPADSLPKLKKMFLPMVEKLTSSLSEFERNDFRKLNKEFISIIELNL